MIDEIKRKVRSIIEKQYQDQWDRQIEAGAPDYHRWVTEREQKLAKEESGTFLSETAPEGGEWETSLSVAILEYEALEDLSVLGKLSEDILVLVRRREGLSAAALARIQRIFSELPQVVAVYGDEDRMDGKGHRSDPWYKPDFSPETLLSWFYLGHLVAVRREALVMAQQNALPDIAAGWQRELYSLMLALCLPLTQKEIFHCPEILYHNEATSYDFWGMEDEFADIRRRYDAKRKRIQGWKPGDFSENGVSVIIPSKDHPGLLEQCLRSVRETAECIPYEIIVVDNGSNVQNRTQIEALQKEFGFLYDYCPMEFNFSAMCNRGAQKSNKEHLLFLNDDCQPFQKDWLEDLAEQSSLAEVGAVGAKLYYPDSRRIQHCGIYGLWLGPVHKLQFQEDDRVYYDRRNRDVRNVLAVTAACLMVKKELFRAAGGFDEEFRVAFNDVELCYRLYEMGYRNVIHNEVALYHHESYSRGDDSSAAKRRRLLEEKGRLYKKHPRLWGEDPYYHPLFTAGILDVNYSFAYQYPAWEEEEEILHPHKLPGLPSSLREDLCLVPTVEFAGDTKDWLYGDTSPRSRERLPKEGVVPLSRRPHHGTWYLQGHLVVLGSDNACYKKEILLYHGNTESYYRLSPTWRYRPDLAENLKDQKRVAISGFACLVDTGELPPGEYRLLFLAEEKLTRQCLLRVTEMTLQKTASGTNATRES